LVTNNVPAVTDHNRKFLVFSLPGSLYALDLNQVAEVGDPPLMWPIPLAPPCYNGALSFHGDIVAVMDLALFLGLPGPGKPEKIVVLQQEVASLAFLVDAVVRIVSEEEVSFSDAPVSGLATSTMRLSDGEAILLDLDALVREAEAGMQRNQQVSGFLQL
jgi:purine-binding chemotaxis protein CheW